MCEKKMEPFNSGELKKIFRKFSCIALIGLITSGKRTWQEEEVTRKDSSTALTHQEKLFTTELFKVIQDAISLILQRKTMSRIRTISSSPYVMSDVQSICILSLVLD